MKKFFALVCCIVLLGLSVNALADARVIQDFQGYTDSNELQGDLTLAEGTRAQYTLDDSNGKALRITLGGPEAEASSLQVPIDNRDWTGATGLKVDLSNATHTNGMWFDLYLTSRADDGSEYYLHASQVTLRDASGTVVDATRKQTLTEIPADFNGTYSISFENATMTDENGNSTTKFNFSNVVKVDFAFDTAGKDLADSAVVLDNIALTSGDSATATVTPAITATQTPANTFQPTTAPVVDTPASNATTWLVIAVIAVVAIGGIAVTIAFYTRRRR